MADLEFEVQNISAKVKKEVTCEDVLTAGGKAKMEIGEHELDETYPEGKIWTIVGNIRIIETDAE